MNADTLLSGKMLILLYAVVILDRFRRLHERWSAPLLRGPGYFFGAAVPTDFMAAAGKRLLRVYRWRLLIPWAIEIPALLAILLFTHRIFVLLLIAGIAYATRANYYLARLATETAARTLAPPGDAARGTVFMLSLQVRRLADYTRPWVEVLVVGLSLGSLGWRLYEAAVATTASARGYADRTLIFAAVLIYAQVGVLLLKRAIVRARDVIPAEGAEQYTVWRESFRRLSTGQCDAVRLLLAACLTVGDLMPVALRHFGPHLMTDYLAGVAVLAVVCTVFEARRVRRYLQVARRTKPAILIARPDAAAAGGLFRFLPDHPALLLGTPTGYALNLGGTPARAAGAYLAGFAGLWILLLRLLPA